MVTKDDIYRMKENKDVSGLIQALGDDDVFVVVEAIEAIVGIGEASVELLTKTLQHDSNSTVREVAAEALGRIADRRAVEPLIKALGDNAENVRQNAAVSLGEIGDSRAVEPLIKALGDNHRLVRLYAVKALCEIGDVKAFKPLKSALNDTDEGVQEEAKKAVGKIEPLFAQTKKQAENLEKSLKYEDAVKLYEELDMQEDASRCRELLQQQKPPTAPAAPAAPAAPGAPGTPIAIDTASMLKQAIAQVRGKPDTPSMLEQAIDQVEAQRSRIPVTKEEPGHPSVEDLAEVERGLCYLVESESTDGAYKLFVNELKKDRIGLCITRNFPERVNKQYQINMESIIWLTTTGGKKSIRPSDLERLRDIISRFMAKYGKAVLLLDGVEYLITHNKYASVLKFIQSLRDQVSLTKSSLIIPISPSAIQLSELKLLERDVDQVLSC